MRLTLAQGDDNRPVEEARSEACRGIRRGHEGDPRDRPDRNLGKPLPIAALTVDDHCGRSVARPEPLWAQEYEGIHRVSGGNPLEFGRCDVARASRHGCTFARRCARVARQGNNDRKREARRDWFDPSPTSSQFPVYLGVVLNS